MLSDDNYEVILFGSSIFKALIYAGDIDLMQIIPVEEHAEALLKIVKQILKYPEIMHGDIKAGRHPTYYIFEELVGKINNCRIENYKGALIRQYAKKLNINELLNVPLSISNISEWVKIFDIIHKIATIRWTFSDVIKGYTMVENNKYFLVDAVKNSKLTKVDTFIFISGRYLEMTTAIIKDIPETKILYQTVIESGLGYLYDENPNYNKALKRFYSGARMIGDTAFLQKITPYLTGNINRLASVITDLKTVVAKMGIINFFIEDTFKYAVAHNLVSQSDINFLNNYAKNRQTAPAKNTAGKYFGLEKNKNLIIIQVESLENAVINKTINGQEITPNLNQLTNEGLYFDNYYTQVGPGNTADAEFSTMDSLYPLPDDVVFIDYAKNNYSALPQLLVKNGYKTYSMHGDVPTFWNRSNMYPALGYQKAYSLSDYTVTRPVGEGPSDLGDEDLFSQSLPRLESFKQPFMATLITMSLHTPFILPADLQTLDIPSQTNLTQTQWEYMQAAHYTDKAIGEFIDGLKKDGLYDNSLILIWGDHGSFQNISGALSQMDSNLNVASVGDGQNINLPQDLLNSQVPMIMLAPGINLNGATNTPGSHIDIYPTVANLLGIPTPKTILGQDLLNTKTPIETHFEIVSGGIDAILTSDLIYQASENGEFKTGSCKSWPSQKLLPIDNCQSLYNQQANNIKASSIIVRGNLLNYLTK